MLNHPIAFAAVTLFAVGFVIYQLLKKEEAPHGGRGGRGPSNSEPPPSPPPKKTQPPRKKISSPPKSESPPTPPKSESPPTPPKSESPTIPPKSPSPGPECAPSPCTKSIKAHISTNYNTGSEGSENCVRRRNVCLKDTNSDSSNTVTSNERDTKEKSISNSSRDGGQNQLSNTFNDNIDVKNYKMNVVDKLKEEVKSINIDPEEQRSSDDNITDSDSDNDMFEESMPELSTRGASGSQLQTDEVELTYKRNVREKLKSDVENMDQKVDCKKERQHENVRRNEVASTSLGHSQHSRIVGSTASGRFVVSRNVNENTRIDMDPKVCRACEEKPCDAVAYPCGHCNLCSECAERFFRLYKKCNFCLSDIEGYQY